MKEHFSGVIAVLRYGIIMGFSLSLHSGAMAAETQVQGWEVDQETTVNLFNIQSRLESYDKTAEILADKNLMPVFQSLKVTSPDISGFRGAASITQLPRENGNFSIFNDYKSAKLLQARASYRSSFEKGSVNFWLGALWQEQEIKSISTGYQANDENFGYNIGIDLNYAGITLTGSYYSGQGIDTLYINPYYSLETSNCLTGLCQEFDNEGYILKGAYALSQTTKLGISYGESSHYSGLNISADNDSEQWTIGLYHDVNSWLKIVAKYNNFTSLNYGFEEDTEIFSLGGSIRW